MSFAAPTLPVTHAPATVRGAAPRVPIAHASSAPRADTPRSAEPVIAGCTNDHDWPPSTLPKMTPFWPTAQPWSVSPKATLLSTNVLTFCLLQLFPPSRVRKITPFWPTIQPWSASAKKMSRRFSLAASEVRVQLRPPSPVRSKVPEFPTAQPSVALVNHTPFKLNEVTLI
jgi:hypothetical protein